MSAIVANGKQLAARLRQIAAAITLAGALFAGMAQAQTAPGTAVGRPGPESTPTAPPVPRADPDPGPSPLFGRVAPSGSGFAGERQQTGALANIVPPNARLSTRIRNRVDNRLRTRIDRAYQGPAATTDAFEKAGEAVGGPPADPE